LNEVYETVETLHHEPCQVPSPDAVHSAVDTALAQMLEVLYGRHLTPEEGRGREVERILFDTAHWIRERGDHLAAGRLLWELGRRERWPGKVIKAFLKLPVHGCWRSLIT
jgi:hypothetical protein